MSKNTNPNPPPENRTLYADDCLTVLKNMPDGCIDLIYLDPPFNSNQTYNLPFKRKLKKDVKPVEVFKDTWKWEKEKEGVMLDGLRNSSKPNRKGLAELISLAWAIDDSKNKTTKKSAAYLCNMAIRLLECQKVLKDTGSIYLHCDPTMSHYLKLVLDLIFGRENFRNEIVWHYSAGHSPKKDFKKKHNIIFRYSKTNKYKFNQPRMPYFFRTEKEKNAEFKFYDKEGRLYRKNRTKDKHGKDKRFYFDEGTPCDTVWSYLREKPFNSLSSAHPEKLGYPTQKPLALLERIIKASSNEGDFVLDPFCGCGTAVHAAENLKRKWIGIDISKFSTGLIRERICNNSAKLELKDITIFNVPIDVKSARALHKQDEFEFEKWVCGEIGAHGMFHRPGERGPDKGVDGVIDFVWLKGLNKISTGYAIVQVKGGKVTPDSVKALNDDVKKFGATAGIFVCFKEYMNTVENNRNADFYEDISKKYPVIQGFSIEDLLAKKKPDLPPHVLRQNALFN